MNSIKKIENIVEKKIIRNSIQLNIFNYFWILIEMMQIKLSIISLLKNYNIEKNLQIAKHSIINEAGNTTISNNDSFSSGIVDYVNYLSFNHLTKNLKTCENFKINSTNLYESVKEFNIQFCGYPNSTFLLVVSSLFFYLFYITYDCRIEEKVNSKKSFKFDNFRIKNNWNTLYLNRIFNKNKIFQGFVYNIHYFMFHILGHSIIDIIFNFVIINFYKYFLIEKNVLNFALTIIGSLSFILYVGFYAWHIRKINILISYSKDFKYPNDNMFGKKYGFFSLSLKLLLVIENNLSEWKIKKFSALPLIRTYIFLVCLIFLFYVILEIFERKILFLINMNINFFRIISVMLINISLLSNLLLSSSYISNFTNIIFFSFSLFVSYFLSSYIFKINLDNILHSNNLVHQLAFIVNEKLEFLAMENNFENSYDYKLKSNKKYQQFKNYASLIIIHHNNKCTDKKCILKKNYFREINNVISAIKKKLKSIYLNGKKLSKIDEEFYIITLIATDFIKPKILNDIPRLLLMAFKYNNLYKNNNYSQNGNKISIIIDLLSDKIKFLMENIKGNFNNSSNNIFDLKQFINYELIYTYSNIFDDFAKSINLVSETIDSIISLNYEKSFKIIQALNLLKEDIKSKFILFNKFKDEYHDLYSFYFI